jgi:uncharacterized protein (DUF952 family)
MTPPRPHPSLIFKVLSRAEYELAASSGLYKGSEVDRIDGYIHFSTASQLAETLRRHYAGKADLLILAVPAAPLGASLRWEPSRGGDLFPHLYADLPLSQVTDMAKVSVGAEGNFELPDMVQ